MSTYVAIAAVLLQSKLLDNYASCLLVLQALTFTFPEEGAVSLAGTEADNLSFAQRVANGDSSAFSAADVPELSGTVRYVGACFC